MITISRLAVLAALLTIGSAAISLPTAALAQSQDNCSRTDPSCPPDLPDVDQDDDDDNDDGDDDNDDDDDGDNDSGLEGGGPGGGGGGGIADNGELAIDCRLKDNAPVTDDLWLVNVGRKLLPAGTKVSWRIPASGQHGAFLLPRDIPVGEERVLAGFLAEVAVGSDCRVKILL